MVAVRYPDFRYSRGASAQVIGNQLGDSKGLHYRASFSQFSTGRDPRRRLFWQREFQLIQ